VHQDIERAPFAFEQRKGGIDLIVDLYIERHQQLRADRSRERLDAILEHGRIGKGELRALRMHRFGDAPGNGTFGGDADDQRAFAGQDSH
jgi:hypothetical protein